MKIYYFKMDVLERLLAKKRLLNLRQGHEEEIYVKKTVEYLQKSFKKNNNGCTMEDFEQALNLPNQQSKCVTILSNSDGRIQIYGKKGYPHVICCRIWRWPNLQNYHELEPHPFCMHPFRKRSGQTTVEICVNPYHYNLVEGRILPSVLLPKLVNQVQIMEVNQLNGLAQPDQYYQNQSIQTGFMQETETYEELFMLSCVY